MSDRNMLHSYMVRMFLLYELSNKSLNIHNCLPAKGKHGVIMLLPVSVCMCSFVCSVSIISHELINEFKEILRKDLLVKYIMNQMRQIFVNHSESIQWRHIYNLLHVLIKSF